MRWRVVMMAIFGLAAVGAVLPSRASAASGSISFLVDGVQRSAYITEKARLRRKTRPVIILVQDAARDAPIWRRALRFQRFTDNGGILVHAEPSDGVWDLSSPDAVAREAAYLRRLVDEVSANALADKARVYLVGVGSGGVVALQAACSPEGRFAGVASVLSSMSPAALETCRPAQPLSALFIAGTADKKVPIEGGSAALPGYSGPLASIESVAGNFAKLSSCGPRRQRADVPDRDRGDGSKVIVETFSGCKEPVRLVRIQGGEHVPPMRARGARVPGQNRDLSTSRSVLSFFRLPGG
jgi:polyhydroxybutyrate depolymerase